MSYAEHARQRHETSEGLHRDAHRRIQPVKERKADSASLRAQCRHVMQACNRRTRHDTERGHRPWYSLLSSQRTYPDAAGERGHAMDEQDKVNILMVDDQPGKLLSYEAILADLGENLITARSGREALELLLQTDVAVVLLDVNMPEIDGFALAAMIRQHPRYQHTAILFISGMYLTERDMLKGYAHGAVDYIAVPIIPELLRAKVRVFADLYRKTTALQREMAERQRLERDAQRSQHVLLLGRLSASVSHEIRNPLGGP
jgi:CheY-like chemotaxis protein